MHIVLILLSYAIGVLLTARKIYSLIEWICNVLFKKKS